MRFFASFSLLAGGLILVSSILATRLERTRESVYYKVLGGRASFVYTVFIYENGLVGLFSGGIALMLAHAGSWALCRYLFEIDYSPDILASIILLAATVVIVICIGLGASRAVIRQKPARFLREHGNG